MFKEVKKDTYVVSGKALYCVVNKPREEKKYKSDEVELRYRTDLILDDAEHAALLKLFSKRKVKQEFKLHYEKDAEGNPIDGTEKPTFQFRRDAVQNDNGEYVEGPVVLGTNGKPLGDTLIGNGSDIIVSFNLVDYTHAKQVKSRVVLNGVKVINLVAYEAPPKAPPPKPDLSVFESDDESEIPF